MSPQRRLSGPGGRKPPGGGSAKALPAFGGPSQEIIDRNNVHSIVTDEECASVLKVNDENKVRIKQEGRIFLPKDFSDPELMNKQWRQRVAKFHDTGVSTDTAVAVVVTPAFIKLLIAEFQKGRQVTYEPPGTGKRTSAELEDGAPGSSQPNKRPAIAGDPPAPTPDLSVRGVGREFFAVTPSILRKPEGAELDYVGGEFHLTDGTRPVDLTTDFQRVHQMINSLNPLLPQSNANQHPIYSFQRKMNLALELLKTKCKSIAASNETMMTNIRSESPDPVTFAPKLDKMQTNVLEAVQKLQSVVETKRGVGVDGGGSADTSHFQKEMAKLKQENETLKKGIRSQKIRADEMESALEKERRKADKYVKLERLKMLESAGFLVNNQLDPPPVTLEACDLIVMNKPSQYWSDYDQNRFEQVDHEKKREMMMDWDPTDPNTPHPAWASYDRECPICNTVIGPEGGYSAGTCVMCIYHPGCLQQFLLSGTRLECAQCNVRFNLRLWHAFKCTQLYVGLMPELGRDGRELPKRTQDMTDQEFTEWVEKDHVFTAVHAEIFKVLIPKRNQVSDAQFRSIMDHKLIELIDRKAASWGLTKPEWISDVKMNIRAIVYHEEEGLGVPPFPQAIIETGFTTRSDYPRSFWRPANNGAAGPSRA